MIAKAIFVLFFISAIAFASYFIYQNIPGQAESFQIQYQDQPKIFQSLQEAKQLYPNMRFNHNNLTYYFGSECSEDRKGKMKIAFSIIHEETQIISFKETQNINSDIMITCSEIPKRKGKILIAGEGGPSQFLNNTIYPLIITGEVLLYKFKGCEYPVVEIHELLHVFGFDHINNSDYIMYPHLDCNQELSQKHINELIRLYSIEPFVELTFIKINATKKGRYLDFVVQVENQGLIDSKNVSLKISTKNKEIETLSLEKIPFGVKKELTVENLKLPSRSTEEINFEIISFENELNKADNVAELFVG